MGTKGRKPKYSKYADDSLFNIARKGSAVEQLETLENRELCSLNVKFYHCTIAHVIAQYAKSDRVQSYILERPDIYKLKGESEFSVIEYVAKYPRSDEIKANANRILAGEVSD